MSTPPPLPAAPPFTAAEADRWRAARVWRRLESRWLALVPLALCVLAMSAGALPTTCTAPASCLTPWTETATGTLLLVEALVLLARPPRLFAVPVVAGALIWLMPDGLPDGTTRWTALLAHAVLALALFRADRGRAAARRMLDGLAGPPVPFPWTMSAEPRPVGVTVLPRTPHVLAALAVLAGLALAVTGAVRQHADDARAVHAEAVEGTVLSADGDGSTARVGYETPRTGLPRTAELDVWWDYTPRAGDGLRLLADDDGFVRLWGDPYDPASWYVSAGLCAGAGGVLALSAAAGARRRRVFTGQGAPAMRVLVSLDGSGDVLVRPFDAPSGRPLWRLLPSDTYRWWSAAEGGPAWAPAKGPVEYNRYRLPDDDGRPGGPDDWADDWADDGSVPAQPVPAPAEAAAMLSHADRPAPALLYLGPDGPSAQLLVRPAGPEPVWIAQVAGAYPAPPVWWRRRQRFGGEDLAVPALAAEAIAGAEAEEGPVLPEPARLVGMPLPLRCTAGLLFAVPAAALVHLTADGGWYGGLVRPAATCIGMFMAVVGALTWQAGFDRDGLVLVTALRVRRWTWSEVNAAAVHRQRFTVQLRNGRTAGAAAWPSAVLARHLGSDCDPAEVARTVSVLTGSPGRRPVERLSGGGAGRPQILLNRLSLAAVLVFAVGRFVLATVTGS